MEQRELKFRAWDKVEKKWLFGYDYGNLGGFSLTGEVVLCGELGALPLQKILHEVLITQFTGLSDKNGKEIYDGDCLIANLENRGLGKIGIVEWSKKGFWIVHGRAKWSLFLSDLVKTQEVIGNIFENPELLSK